MKRSHKFVFFLIWLVVAATFLFSILQFANLRPHSAPGRAGSGTNNPARPLPEETH